MKKKLSNGLERLNCIAVKLDGLPLWWIGILELVILLLPNLSLGEGSVFVIHDQWDESMMNYVLTARHPMEGLIPEMLGGISAGGLAPAAVFFVPLYQLLPPFWAFLCTYALMMLCGFMGMYAAVKELTDSSLLSALAAGIFGMLPLYPIYGLSQSGIPLALYAFVCLYKKKRIPLSLALVILFGGSSHLVCTGYVVLAFAVLAMCVTALRGKFSKWFGLGFVCLLLTYVLTNLNLLAEFLLGRSPGGAPAYVSHREEMVNGAEPFWNTVKEVFLHSSQHAPAYHEGLILPILAVLVIGGFCYAKMERSVKNRYLMALCGMVILALIAVFYGICRSEVAAAWKNGMSGFLRYFQAERFYWIYPAGWYLEFALAFSVPWTAAKQSRRMLPALCAATALLILPTADKVLYDSYFYMNVNQRNNGSGITGYISWESWYAEELMGRIEEAIGRDPAEYRVAHLGISPAPALMHGFYTVDGYSNNYPLEYKHAFRRVIAGELDKNAEMAVYFDTWGSRCYLFNAQTGNYWMLPKGNGVVYEGLDLDMEALADLGCEYLLSGAEIADAERMGLHSMGYYETEESYWGIWLYALN
ncbi:MAG: DUF6044 family protein [Clostridium sp.]|nr:DUF6044 family protein [Acetatifactor muris]MCM1525905.1 DUF6044 family protein [Bacteroides sp.]MCM1562556.1 DUF6044 family protein [Clostridium sp.]